MKATLFKAVQAGSRVLMEKFDKGVAIDFKGAVDLVTEADRAAEQAIVEAIRTDFPEHDILAEEADYGKFGSSCRWIIDPLDGTTNYAHGFPWFAISIGVEVDGVLTLGAVCNPYVGELNFAERGEGAMLNDRTVRVSTTKALDQALLATGFPYDRKTSEVNNYDHFVNFQQAARACRRPGVASLDLACVAAGRFDGFWEMKLKPWDVAAGILLVREAGGRVTDFDGVPAAIDRGECLATNGWLHQPMQDLLQQGRRP